MGVFHEDYCGISRLRRRADGFCTGFHKHSQALASTRKQLQVSTLADYSTRIQSVGGATTGTGGLNMYASTIGLMPTVGVGIGTTVPSASLHIKNATSAMRVTGNLTNASTRPALSTTPGAFEIRGSGLYDGSDDGFLRLSAGGGSSTNVQSYIDLSGYSTVADMSANIIFGTLGLERMRIISNGYVGIGLTVPSAAMLHIGSSGIVRLGPSGNIGTTSAALGAEVSRYQIGFSAFRDIGVDQIGSKIVSINYNGWQNANPLTNYTELAFFTTSQTSGGSNYVDTTSERVRITGSGNVGIGTTNPQATLHVVGNLRSQSVVYSLYGQATAANATNTTVSLMNINGNGTYLVSVSGVGGGFVNVSGVALVAFYYDGASSRFANINSISVVNFIWSSITASTGAITFQQTTGYSGVVCAFYALRIA